MNYFSLSENGGQRDTLAKSLGVPVSGIMDDKYTISINLNKSKLLYVMWRMFYHRIACWETENF